MVSKLGRIPLWNISAALISALVLLPVLSILWIALTPGENIWPHLLATTLPRYFSNSLILMAATGTIAALIGTVTAWLVVTSRFPGRDWLEWALLLPLAVPVYISAWALADFMDYAGPLQTMLRASFGWVNASDYWFPDLRSRGGAVLVLALGLYPYVYLLARAAFRDQSATTLDVARALGSGPLAVLCRVALPMARPAIWAGAAIVMMEVLGDFGAVDYFGVQTLTTGVFSVWTQSNNAAGAAQISCVILILILTLVLLEKSARKRQRFHPGRQSKPVERTRLRGGVALLATSLCALPFLLGFALPVAVLGRHAIGESWLVPDLARALAHSLILGIVAAAVTVSGGLVLVFALRQSRRLQMLLPLTALGYAAPGAVLALGVLVPLSLFDNALADLVALLSGQNIGLLLTGSGAALVLAYFVRFFAVAQNAIEAAFGRVVPEMDMAARTLGQGPGAVLVRVHLPMIRGSLLVAGLLIFTDAVKELPATLMLRPFNFETLATLAYGQASLENIGAAAPAALIVTLVGILPVVLLARATRHGWRPE